jgi:hypothetical protein
MSRTIEIAVTSDLSHEHPASTVQFNFDGTSYEIDLTADEYDDLAETLQPYLNVARPATAKKATTRSYPAPDIIRAWAAGANIDIPARGRLPQSVITQYLAAERDAVNVDTPNDSHTARNTTHTNPQDIRNVMDGADQYLDDNLDEQFDEDYTTTPEHGQNFPSDTP